MSLRLFLIAFGLSASGAAADAAVVNFSYQTQTMNLVEVPGGYSAPQFSGTLPEQQSFSFGFSLELDALRGRIANTQISYRNNGMGGISAEATRNGRTVASMDASTPAWMFSGFPVNTFGATLSLSFDALGEIDFWHFGTDGENSTYSFGAPSGDRYVFATIYNWTPDAPVWLSDGPGTWTHDPLPAPVPLPAGAAGLSTALALLGFAGWCAARKPIARVAC